MKRRIFRLVTLFALLFVLSLSAFAAVPMAAAQTQSESDPLITLLLVVGLPLLITTIVCLVQRSKMKTAVEKTSANEYVTPQGVNFRVRTDQFTHTTRTRIKINQSSGKGGSRG